MRLMIGGLLRTDEHDRPGLYRGGERAKGRLAAVVIRPIGHTPGAYLRDKSEGTNLENTYKQIMKDLYMPQKDKVSPAPAGPGK